jgi:hypothetical protein
MPEFQTDEHRDAYIGGVLDELKVAEKRLADAVEAGLDKAVLAEKAAVAHIKEELARVGHEAKKPAAETRPAKPAAETR